jgi:myosin heavy subunit
MLSPKLFTEMMLEVCEVPQGEYKLGVGRIFLKHRAAQMLDALHYFDQVRVRVRVRVRVALLP